MSSEPIFRRLLVVIKQTAYEEFSQLRARGQAPKGLRWKRLQSRYESHKECVSDLLSILRRHNILFSCVNRVELDRQHLEDVDLVIAVGGDGTVLSTAHYLDAGTIPLLGINSEPTSDEDKFAKKKSDERRSRGALCACTATNMKGKLPRILHGGGVLSQRTRIQCIVKSTFSDTQLVPALNDLLITNNSPAAVSRFRMGWLNAVDIETAPMPGGVKDPSIIPRIKRGGLTRFGGKLYDVQNSLNIWSSGMWVSTGTGSTAAMASAGGKQMDIASNDLQYLIREHMIENSPTKMEMEGLNNGILMKNEQLHLRWNSHKGRIFIDGSHLSHNLELGDEVLINGDAPPLALFTRDD